jgi:3-phosphoshikimate 1-carboxyvinyltransferase
MGAQAEQSESATRVWRGGNLRGAELDMSEMPDMTLTVAVAALFAQGTTTIRGVEVLRHHETDRLAAATVELRKLGAEVDEYPDGLRIVPPAGGPNTGIEIDTYDDHRMAMAFSMVGDVVIRDPGCVAKTFPSYFSELEQLGMLAATPS